MGCRAPSRGAEGADGRVGQVDRARGDVGGVGVARVGDGERDVGVQALVEVVAPVASTP